MEDILNFRFEVRENKGLFFFFFFASKFTDALNLSTHLLGLSSGPGNHVPALTEPQVDERQDGSRQLDRLEN